MREQSGRLAGIKAVAFDGDMTLWDFEKVMRRALALVLEELRRRMPGRGSAALTVERMAAIRDEVAEELGSEVLDLERIRLLSFVRTVELAGRRDDDLAEELNALYFKHRFAAIELYPDVLPALEALGARYPLGLVSNGNTRPEHCGLGGRFGFVVFAQEAGCAKPDRRIFAAACRQAGCMAPELLHVGDSLENDVAGANAFGAVSVWLNRDGRANGTGVAPAFEIRSLDQLVGLLGPG
jgi:FMN hydrolase / 5-amino-6-(5-phospho-D-ribitylamino)uracil phosphatase